MARRSDRYRGRGCLARVASWFVALGALAFASGCRTTSAGDPSETLFRVENLQMPLLARLYDSEIPVCLAGEYWWSEAEHKRIVLDAFETWFEVFRHFDPGLRPRVRLTCEGDKILTISHINRMGRAQGPTIWKPTIEMFSSQLWYGRARAFNAERFQSVMTHEIGHGFGLADTYLEKGGKASDQPSALMNRMEEITEDDELGMAVLFAARYGERVSMDDWATLDRRQKVWRLVGRVTGRAENPCFYAQYREVVLALSVKYPSPEILSRLASRAGQGPRRSLIMLEPVSRLPGDSHEPAIADRGEYISIHFVSGISDARPVDGFSKSVTATRDVDGHTTQCVVVGREAVEKILVGRTIER